MKIIKDNNVKLVSFHIYRMFGIDPYNTYHPNCPIEEFIFKIANKVQIEALEYLFFGLNPPKKPHNTKENVNSHEWAGVGIHFNINGKDGFINVYPPQWRIDQGIKKFTKENLCYSYEGKYPCWLKRKQIIAFVKNVLGIIK